MVLYKTDGQVRQKEDKWELGDQLGRNRDASCPAVSAFLSARHILLPLQVRKMRLREVTLSWD